MRKSMNERERLADVTACAARVFSKPVVMVPATCSHCGLPNGEVPDDPAYRGRRVDRMHAACVPAFRAALIGAPSVAA